MTDHFKHISLVVLLSITTLIRSGDCIQNGMNLWQLSQNIACSVGSYCEINLSNLAAGITAPGLYKLCGSISSGTQLVISASDVILDLGGYVLVVVPV